MRRGQLLSLDALLSLVMVIFILGAITNASDTVKGEIASMVGWYERANIADNMLDVLTKSPGEPENWTAAPSTVKVLGLRSKDYPYALSLRKIEALKSLPDVTPIIKTAEDKDFKLDVYVTRTQFIISGSFPKNASSDSSIHVEASVVYPENSPTPYYTLTVINGSEVTNTSTIEASQERSPWIEHVERRMPLEVLRYSANLTVPNHAVEWISGQLKLNVPSYAYLTIKVPANASGNLTLTVRDGNLLKGVLVERNSSNLQAVVATSDNAQPPSFYSGNITTIRIPWSAIFSEFNPDMGAKTVSVWVQGNTFNGGAVMVDEGHIIALMEPRFERAVLKLWVWDDS